MSAQRDKKQESGDDRKRDFFHNRLSDSDRLKSKGNGYLEGTLLFVIQGKPDHSGAGSGSS
jgi:hypothetical protein